MKKKLFISLFITLGLLTNYKIQAAPAVIMALEALNQGASCIGLIKTGVMGATIIGPMLSRVGIAQALVVANIALSLKIKKDTTTILAVLEREFSTVHGTLKKMQADSFEQSMRNSLEHKVTQEDIASLTNNVNTLDTRMTTGLASLEGRLSRAEVSLGHQIRALKAQAATKKDSRRLELLERRRFAILNKKADRILMRMDTFEKNQIAGNSGISSILGIFKKS